MPEISSDLVSPFLALPALRGLWVASVDSGGDWYDLSGLGKTLSYNGDPEFNYDGLVPYWDYDGAGDFHSRADEADLDITSTETYVAAAVRGLTFGGWFWVDAITTADGLIGKFEWTGGDWRAYVLDIIDSGQVRLLISSDGTAGGQVLVTSTNSTATSAWFFVVGRFDPSTELAIFLNNVKTTNVISIPANIFNSPTDFEIGAYNVGDRNLDGRAVCCFLCAAACSDAQISSVFEQSRAAFGV